MPKTDTAKRPYSKPTGTPRERVFGGNGPWVSTPTRTQIRAWHDRGFSYGQIVEGVVAHAKRTGYKPESTAK